MAYNTVASSQKQYRDMLLPVFSAKEAEHATDLTVSDTTRRYNGCTDAAIPDVFGEGRVI